jgi:hypothetical protein
MRRQPDLDQTVAAAKIVKTALRDQFKAHRFPTDAGAARQADVGYE